MTIAASDSMRADGLHVLVVDGDQDIREMCAAFVSRQGYQVHTAKNGQEALSRVRAQPPDIVLMDLRLRDGSGLEVLREIKALDEGIEVILMTAHSSVNTAVVALKSGASDYLTRPPDLPQLRRSLDLVARAGRLNRENRRLRQFVAGHFGFENIIGESAPMKEVYHLIRKIAPSDVNCLVLGESGTGKEQVARALHLASRRAGKPFVAVNCGAIPKTLVESELFGHVRGAFTGAIAARAGYFLEASGGTLLLDEISEMPLGIQVKLLRAVENQEIRPVGASDVRPIDVRLVAATNADLSAAVREGSFREDLYYRLNVVQISLPPLRERAGDVPLLVQHFLSRQSGPAKVDPAAMRALESYPWPGNVRELLNAIRRACVLSTADTLTLDDLPPRVRETLAQPGARRPALDSLAEAEKAAIIRTLEALGGDRTASAKSLGINRSTLYRKMKRYKIQAGGRQNRPND